MSKLSELLPAGGGGKQVDFVASGTLPNGRAVLLKSNGQVEVVGTTTIAADIPYGSETTFGTNRAQYVSKAAFDPNTVGKFVIAFVDRDNPNSNSKHAAVIVGQVSGSSISFGTPVIINSEQSYFTTVAFDPNNANKILVAFRGSSNNYGKARVGTISGTSVSLGSLATFNSSANTNYINIAFDPNTSNKLVISFADSGSSNSKAMVGTISGTSVSFGSAAVFDAVQVPEHGLAFDPNIANKFVLAYQNGTTSGLVKIGTVSGTSLSFGSASTFNSASTDDVEIAFDPNTANKFIVVYKNRGASNVGTARVGTISNASISYGTAVVYNSDETTDNQISFDPNTANTFVVAYYRNNGLTGRAKIGTISGTSLSFSSHYIFNPSLTNPIGVRFDPSAAGRLVFTYIDGGKAYALTGISTHQGSNLTATNFIGITDAAIASGATGSVTVKGGVATNLSSLTIGSTYYVQTNGTFATSAGTPSVEAGKAISATSLILKG